MFYECVEVFIVGGNYVVGDDIGIDDVDIQLGKCIVYQCFIGVDIVSQVYKEWVVLCRFYYLVEYLIEVCSFNFLLIEQGYLVCNGEVWIIRNGQVFILMLFNYDYYIENSIYK